MLAWWILPLILTVLSVGTVIWVAYSDDPWAGMIAIGLGALMAPVNLLAWSFCYLLAQLLDFLTP